MLLLRSCELWKASAGASLPDRVIAPLPGRGSLLSQEAPRCPAACPPSLSPGGCGERPSGPGAAFCPTDPHPLARSGPSAPADTHRAEPVLLHGPHVGSGAGRSNRVRALADSGATRSPRRCRLCRGCPPLRPGCPCAALHGTAEHRSRRTAPSLPFPCKTAPTPDRRKVSKRAAGPRLPPR